MKTLTLAGIEVKVVGYYSTITNRTYTRKSDRTRAENKVQKDKFDQKKQQLINKFNN